MKLRFLLLNPAPLCLVTAILQPSIAGAQEPPPPAAPPPPAVAQAPAVAPPPAVAQAPAAEAPIPAAPTPEQPTPPPAALQQPADPNAPPPPTTIAPAAPEVAPAAEPPKDDLGAISVGAWGRVDLVFSNGAVAAPGNFPSGDKVDDTFSTGEFEFHASGKVQKYVSLTLNMVASYAPDLTSDFSIMDGIVQIEPSPYFNVWLGRHLVAIDRSNFAGPYFMSPWFYPGFGFADGQVAVPREGPYGRNDGATVWGQVEGGMFKYFAGVFDLYNPGDSPLYTGRLSVSLLNPEPGFWGTATYHGLDVFSVGLGAQYKHNGSAARDAMGNITATDDYSLINVDVLFEKNLGASGVLDLEGAFLKFNGDYEGTDIGWFALASYILPAEVAGGKLQPLVRFQQANAPDDGPSSWILDAQVNYILNSYATRFSLGFRHSEADDDAIPKVSALFLGVQVQK